MTATFSVPLPMTDPAQLVPLARAADELGYAAVALPDSVFFPKTASASYPYSEDGDRYWSPETPFVDPFLAFAAMGAVTERLRFFTNVYKLPLRHPLLVAKEVSSLAVLTGGRFSLGVGLAWIPEEFEYTQSQKSTRGARTDEAIDIIRAVCSGAGPAWVEHHGTHYDFGPVMISPAPTSTVPILGAGHSEPALRRAAERCDGWISTNTTVDEIERVVASVRSMRVDTERFADDFHISVLSQHDADLDTFRRIAEIDGVSDVQVVPWYLFGGDSNDLDNRLASLERFYREVVEPLG